MSPIQARRTWAVAALLAGALCAPPAAADTEMRWVLLESQPGDYIGAGQSYLFSGTDRPIAITPFVYHVNQGTIVEFDDDSGGHWKLTFGPPAQMDLVAGEYPGARNEYSFQRPRLSVTAPGRECDQASGWFEILESPPGEFAANFVQHCNGADAALFGAVRVKQTWPLVVPTFRAVAGADTGGVVGGTVTLDGRLSFAVDGDGANTSKSYAWTQVAGPAVTLQGSTTAQPSFTVPPVRPGGANFEFRLDVVDELSRSDSDTVRVGVPAKGDPQTYMYFNSQAGDPVGDGRKVWLVPEDGGMLAANDPDDATRVEFGGVEHWLVRLQAPGGGPPAPGIYENAVRFPLNGPAPGLSAYLFGHECGTVTGRFEVLHVLTNASDFVTQFAADFEQHCDGAVPALFGEMRINYPPPGLPTAAAGANLNALSGTAVALNGGASSDAAPGSLAAFEWRQTGGPSVALSGAKASQASFTAPQVSAPATLTFELMVTDDEGLTAIDTVSVTVRDAGDSGIGGGTATGALSLLALAGFLVCGAWRRAARTVQRAQ